MDEEMQGPTLESLLNEIKTSPCECGSDHIWFEWREYTCGPFSPETARLLVSMIAQARLQAVVSETDPMTKMIVAGVAATPGASPCRDS